MMARIRRLHRTGPQLAAFAVLIWGLSGLFAPRHELDRAARGSADAASHERRLAGGFGPLQPRRHA